MSLITASRSAVALTEEDLQSLKAEGDEHLIVIIEGRKYNSEHTYNCASCGSCHIDACAIDFSTFECWECEEARCEEDMLTIEIQADYRFNS